MTCFDHLRPNDASKSHHKKSYACIMSACSDGGGAGGRSVQKKIGQIKCKVMRKAKEDERPGYNREDLAKILRSCHKNISYGRTAGIKAI